MSDVMTVADADFENEVIKSELPVLIDMWAVWCGPCKMIEPSVNEIAKDYAGKLKVVKMNVDESPKIPSKFGVRSIPTLLLFKNGELKDQLIGAVPKKQIVDKVEKLIIA
jgi:thioredoxin 1